MIGKIERIAVTISLLGEIFPHNYSRRAFGCKCQLCGCSRDRSIMEINLYASLHDEGRAWWIG